MLRSVILFILALFPCVTLQPAPRIDRILILGNSIAFQQPMLSDGWDGRWGFAASVAYKDFPHQVLINIAMRQQSIPEMKIIVADIPPGLFPADMAEQIAAFDPDLLIVEFGDDVYSLEKLDYAVYEDVYRVLGDAARATDALAIATGPWWILDHPNDDREKKMRRAATAAGIVFVPIGDLKNPTTTAELEPWCKNHNVCWHPGDKGMAAIAERILAAIYNQPVYLPVIHAPAGSGTIPP